MDREKSFECEIPTAKDHRIKPKLAEPISSGEARMSKFCGEYKKFSKESDFEFPCYIKCDSHIGKSRW